MHMKFAEFRNQYDPSQMGKKLARPEWIIGHLLLSVSVLKQKSRLNKLCLKEEPCIFLCEF